MAQPKPPDPLRDAALSPDLLDRAKQPLPPLTGETKAVWRETLAPVFSFIQGIPAETVEEEAYERRRARVRATADDRKRGNTHTPFHLLDDFHKSPESHLGRPVALHGYLTKLEAFAPGDAESEAPWRTGSLKLWNENRSVRFIAASLPKGFPTGEKLHEPGSVIGFAFETESNADGEKSPELLIVARWVRRCHPALDASYLAVVTDRTIGIESWEYDAYFRTLLHAKLVDPAAQKQAAREFWQKRQKALNRPRPLFVDLFKSFADNPRLYRGQPVTMTGTLRKLTGYEADPLNGFGIEREYEGWFYPEDSQSNPMVVVFTEKPADLPEGSNLSVPVEVTGYVFKMYGYKAQDGNRRVAPMLLAKTMRKLNIPEPESFPMAWVWSGLALLFLGIGGFLWSSHRADKAFRREQLEIERSEEPPRFDDLPIED